MADVIQLLPDAIANQIAAGEVIQRPASVVKELIENAIDAGSTQIKLIVKEAGKSLIQVIDNGCGMSERDARMAFERHATSKIRQSEDLFAIKTMGFRGEAMASIAAIAHVELRSRRHRDEIGVRIHMEGSEVKSQEACQCTAGTSISVKNLFFNVPARRKFLKSNTVEMRHIIDEFQRVALANPDIFFSLHHNNAELFHLASGNLRQRIVGVLGNAVNKKLVPVSEETDVLKLYGYIGKPEFAKRTRGEQFFFVNQRFIKSAYLNHAIMGAYEEMLPKDTYPLYVIFLDIDPARIDINVHPTKQEIKFDDEKLVYNYLKVAVRHALGQYNITPTLDFEQNINFTSGFTPAQTTSPVSPKREKASTSGFGQRDSQKDYSLKAKEAANLKQWEQLYKGLESYDPPGEEDHQEVASMTIKSKWSEDPDKREGGSISSQDQKAPYQIHHTYIISQIKSGFLLIDQQAAHERILYERYLNAMSQQQSFTQKELFPKNIIVAPSDVPILKAILPQVNQLGFDLQEFGQSSFVLHGVPANLSNGKDEQQIIESLIEQYKLNVELKLEIGENIARALAKSACIRRGQKLTILEMRELIDQLFACQLPYKSPSGRHCFLTYELDDLKKRFEG